MITEVLRGWRGAGGGGMEEKWRRKEYGMEGRGDRKERRGDKREG